MRMATHEGGDAERVVIKTPFVWDNPQEPPPGQHYCFITRAVTDKHPNPIPESFPLTDGSDFNKWVQNNPGLGWRNVSFVKCSDEQNDLAIDLVVPHDLVEKEALIYLEAINMP